MNLWHVGGVHCIFVPVRSTPAFPGPAILRFLKHSYGSTHFSFSLSLAQRLQFFLIPLQLCLEFSVGLFHQGNFLLQLTNRTLAFLVLQLELMETGFEGGTLLVFRGLVARWCRQYLWGVKMAFIFELD